MYSSAEMEFLAVQCLAQCIDMANLYRSLSLVLTLCRGAEEAGRCARDHSPRDRASARARMRTLGTTEAGSRALLRSKTPFRMHLPIATSPFLRSYGRFPTVIITDASFFLTSEAMAPHLHPRRSNTNRPCFARLSNCRCLSVP